MKRFIVSYQGSAEYDVNGTRVEVRTFAYDPPYHPFTPEVYESEILPMVGCVWLRYGYQEFPSADIMREFPGYIAARYLPDPEADHAYASRVEYCGSKPRTRHNPTIGAIEADL